MIRQTAALLTGLTLFWSAQAVPHAPAHSRDYVLQLRVTSVSEQARSIRATFQDWLLGRCTTDQARQSMLQGKARLQAFRTTLLEGASPARRAWMSDWLQQEINEVNLLIEQLGQGARKLDTRALSSRWGSSLRSQRDWLRDRQQELPGLLAQARHPQLQGYYQWRASLLSTMSREQQLAEALLDAFQAEKAPDIAWLRYALNLHQETTRVRPPQMCLKAQRIYEKRAAALARLTQSTRDQLSDPSADSGSNLQLDEKAFSDLHLEAEKASLEVLRSLLR